MRIKFDKMHGLGNDFMVIDCVRQQLTLDTATIQKLADRHVGVGFDQLLLVEPAQSADNDFRYRIFNGDGSEVEQCGNGARCFARFVQQQGLSQKTRLRVETAKGLIQPELLSNGQVRVDMGTPQFAPGQIPFSGAQEANTYCLPVAGQSITFSLVSMGNPHAVIQVQQIDQAPVQQIGTALQSAGQFPQSVNVGFMQILSPAEIHLRVYERGAGETLACGSGACAAVASGIRLGLLENHVRVHTQGGDLTIEWAGMTEPVWMTGPAITVFSGEIDICPHQPDA